MIDDPRPITVSPACPAPAAPATSLRSRTVLLFFLSTPADAFPSASLTLRAPAMEKAVHGAAAWDFLVEGLRQSSPPKPSSGSARMVKPAWRQFIREFQRKMWSLIPDGPCVSLPISWRRL